MSTTSTDGWNFKKKTDKEREEREVERVS